jgi:hypothetical protein
MFWTFKLNFDVDILAILGLASVLATFSKIWANLSNHLVTLLSDKIWTDCYAFCHFCSFLSRSLPLISCHNNPECLSLSAISPLV